MDLAPLNLAHTHARKAAIETQKAVAQKVNPQAAIDEHELAAGEFANARKGTEDLEAIRILELLEEEHRRLAEIIKVKLDSPAANEKVSAKTGETTKPSSTSTSPTSQTAPQPSTPVARTSTSPVRTRRNPHRDVSSSIANNLARQRRGLPATPELSTQQAGGRILSHIDRPGYTGRQISPERTRTSHHAPESRIPPSTTPHQQSPRRASEDSFSKFYNTFEGLFSKLSAPLAFAGLPLTAEQAAQESQQSAKKTEKERTRATTSDEPDLTKLISPAALRAVREDAGQAFGPQESFYLVPPTGGTVSYAGILSGGGRGTSQVPETIDEDADEFVDARESLGPPSPRSLRSGRKGGNSPAASRKDIKSTTSNKTMEELELENTALRSLLDTQAKRLQMWEMSSQSQSMALQQSMRAVRQRPDLPNTISDPATLERMSSASTTATDRAVDRDGERERERVKELEAQLEATRKEKLLHEQRNERMARENEKLQMTIGRYRDKWEQLKAGARKRESDKRASVVGVDAKKISDTSVEGTGEE